MSQFSVLDGESIFDIILRTGYSFDQVYLFLQENPTVGNINFDFNSNPGTVVTYDPANIITSAPSDVAVSNPSNTTTVKTTNALDGQSNFDVCLMTYGSFDNMYKLLKDSGLDSINVTDIAQKVFTYDTSLINDPLLFNGNINQGIVYNTASDFIPVSSGYLLSEASFIIITEDSNRILANG